MAFDQGCDDCYWAWCYSCEEWDQPIPCEKHEEEDENA